MYSENGYMYFECSNSYQSSSQSPTNLLKEDNISFCFSKTLTQFCDLEELRNELVSLPFVRRIKGTTLRNSYLQILSVLSDFSLVVVFVLLLEGFVQSTLRKERITVPFIKSFIKQFLREGQKLTLEVSCKNFSVKIL